MVEKMSYLIAMSLMPEKARKDNASLFGIKHCILSQSLPLSKAPPLL